MHSMHQRSPVKPSGQRLDFSVCLVRWISHEDFSVAQSRCGCSIKYKLFSYSFSRRNGWVKLQVKPRVSSHPRIAIANSEEHVAVLA